MFPRNSICPICDSPAFKDTDDVVSGYSCARCGDFRVEGAYWKQGSLADNDVVRLSGWIREQNSAVVTPTITRDIFRRIIARTRPRFRERAYRALVAFASKYPGLDTWVTFDEGDPEYEMLGVSYCKTQSDLDVLIELLVNDGYLNKTQGAFSVSVQGLLKIEDASVVGSSSAIGFVAMSFDTSMNDAWVSGFEPAIHASGFSALRISDKEYVGGITDQIISEIRNARFVIADYTGQKAGVYFEAGFALGLGLTVIPTCRADEVSRLHFDIKHLNTLLWNDPKELADKLARRITAVIGNGPHLK